MSTPHDPLASRDTKTREGALAPVATISAFDEIRNNLVDGSTQAFAVPSLAGLAQLDADSREDLASTDPVLLPTGERVPVSQAELLLLRLQTLGDLLRTGGEVNDLARMANQRRAELDRTLDDALATLFEEQRPVERSYRELSAFFDEARLDASDENLPVMVANVTAEELRRNPELFEQFSASFPKVTALSYTESVGLIIVPGWLRTEANLRKFGDMARNSKALLITDFQDARSLEEATKMFQSGGIFQALKGLEPWKSQVVLAANHLRVRMANRWESSIGDDLYISPGMVLAGKIFKGDDTASLARAQAGDDCKVLLETHDDIPLVARWDLRDRLQIEPFQDCVVPIANRGEGKLVFWGCETLSKEEFGKQYTVRRVQEYIEKCVLEYLNGRTWTENDQTNRDAFRIYLQRFLRENSGRGKMLDGGLVLDLAPVKDASGREVKDKLDVRLRLKFKFTTKAFMVEVREHEENLEPTEGQGGWQL